MELDEGLRVISMNAMHFRSKNRESNDPTAPSEILKWLEAELMKTQTKGMKAVLMYHIPHGTYLTPSGPEQFWLDKYEQPMRVLLKRYNSTISVILTGHTHLSFLDASDAKLAENFVETTIKLSKELGQENAASSFYANAVVNRAASPVYQNNPGFSFLYYNQAFNVPDYYEEYTFLVVNSYNKTDDASNYWIYLYNSKIDLQIEELSAKGIADFLVSLIKDLSKLLKYLLYKLGDPIKLEPERRSDFKFVKEIIKQMCAKYTEDPGSNAMCIDSLHEQIKPDK